MDKNKKFTAWRIVGIVVLCLIVVGGFAGAYFMGVQRGALMDGDTAWGHPMAQYENEDGDYAGFYGSRYPMGMGGYYGRMGHGMGFSFIGRILGGLLFLAFLGALLRLVFFPMHMRRHMMGDRFHYGHPHFRDTGSCCKNDLDDQSIKEDSTEKTEE